MAHYVRPPTRSTSKSSPKVGDATTSRAIVALGRQVSNNLQQADINLINRQVSGNAKDAYSVVTFPVANSDLFVSHGLRYKVKNFEAISPSEPCRISMGSQPPNIYGMFLRSDTAGVTVRIRMFGQKGDQR